MTTVSVLYDGGQVDLAPSETEIVPSGRLLVSVDSPMGLSVRLDGRIATSRAFGGTRLLPIDLTRSTGFHHLEVGSVSYWFGTTDAKLGLDGIKRMTSYLRNRCMRWTGQLLFSDGTVFRDPELVYGWLDQHADAALGTAYAISRQPRRGTESSLEITEAAARPIAARATMALLRRRPDELLIASPGGPVSLAGKTYLPRKVVARSRSTTIATPANRRVVWLVTLVSRLAALVAVAAPDADERQRARVWVRDAGVILTRTPFSRLTLGLAGYAPPSRPLSEEQTDSRYAEIYRRSKAASWLAGWEPTLTPTPIHAYVAYADEIYQAFVVTVLAEALELTARARGASATQPAYAGADLDLYLNSIPPDSVIRTWRSYSSSPDNYRPDVTALRHSDRAVLIGDAKYRCDGERASESSRHDMLAYMAAFGVDRAVLFFPPISDEPAKISRVEGQGRLLLEIPISPVAGLSDYVTDEVIPALGPLFVIPPWRT